MEDEQLNPDPRVRQDTKAGQDAYSAARDVIIHHHAVEARTMQAPGPVRQLWGNIPSRNPGFTGRKKMLAAVRRRLMADGRALVQALYGISGVGKTQLAIEYAHRFAADYDIVWWVSAEQPRPIGEQFAALAEDLGCARPGADVETIRRAVLAELHGRDRWLLIFDNAEDPETLAPWLPGGRGHVLITSRVRRWAEVAAPVEVDVLARGESVAILRDRVGGLAEADAYSVAAALGDLPLGIAQAAGYMADTGTPGKEYLGLLVSRAGQILGLGRPSSYPQPLAAVTQLAFDRLRADDPAAADLAGICAFLAPEPVPADWFTTSPAWLPTCLSSAVVDAMAWRQVLVRVGAHALARVEPDGLWMHRLTQAIVRDQLSPDQAAALRTSAEAIVAASNPGDARAPSSWSRWARLLPHLLALDPATTTSLNLRSLAIDGAWYLYRRGDASASHDLADSLHQRWHELLGPDDTSTLAAARAVGVALRGMGRYDRIRRLDEDTLARYRRVQGEDHPATLIAADCLARDLHLLGEFQAARDLDQDTLARRRRVLGHDDPDTLTSAASLASDLYVLGDIQAACNMNQDTLGRRRRVLGEDHPDTLVSANSLAVDLYVLGEIQAARELIEDTLGRRRHVLGDDHPQTLTSASTLARVLRALGENQAARELDEDTLARRRSILGENHPDTIISIQSLALDLQALGEA